MSETNEIYDILKAQMPDFFDSELLQKIAENGKLIELPENTEILREGQYVKVIPIVLEGVIKVYSRYEDKELLLYYIQPKESCIMSFTASLQNSPSRVYAVTEAPTKAIVIPAEETGKWVQQFQNFSTLFFNLYNQRYSELLDTIHHLLYFKMDQRIYNYLKEKQQVMGSDVIKITHRQMANELGTAREVISRVMKKLEREGSLEQLPEGIKVI